MSADGRMNLMRKFYVNPKVYGLALAEQIAQALHAERAATAGYVVGVSAADVSVQWKKNEEEFELLKKREAELARAKGWTKDERQQPPA
jgi:hypothetical protein